MAEAPLDHIAFKQIHIAGSVGYTVATWVRMLKILEQGKLRLGDVVTHKMKLDDWRAGFAACEAKSALKVPLSP